MHIIMYRIAYIFLSDSSIVLHHCYKAIKTPVNVTENHLIFHISGAIFFGITFFFSAH